MSDQGNERDLEREIAALKAENAQLRNKLDDVYAEIKGTERQAGLDVRDERYQTLIALFADLQIS